ncbi:SMP-30/gluconolactonase/LRE family protein [Hymenobacter glacialis]|uniref:SMP-30/Gluconolactonase/LRE-like region domain-containing protein n=1 Tax=Hymenobacter glacialis TaxID=1908236 RepID=A0A1G1T345_9BACT|nr:SMP-30/gluconolactonase/LRE family protein [Hymenobacter glacialis]OGX85286.1 hypothetical protein BEN48_14885 [Hymenobacter glacialis]
MSTFSLVATARRVVPAAFAGLLLLSSCSDDDNEVMAPAAPAVITFTQAGLYPEGVQYDAPNSRFLVTSLTTGRVGQVKDDGTYSTAFPDDPRLVSAIGAYLDNASGRNRLLVAISDPGANQQRSTAATRGKLARLAIFNNANATAAPTIVELGSLRPNLAHFANDVAVDAQGNAYVTDSFSNLIYKIDPQNTATVFLEDATRLAPPAAGAFGLNGIVFHPDGYLLVAKSDNGALYKVPLNAPNTFTQVTTTQNLSAADGLLLQDNNTLQVVSNAQARVFRLATTNGFTAATLSGTFVTQPQFPTTLARRDGASYVLYANLDKLFGGQTPAVSQFSINRVVFQ